MANTWDGPQIVFKGHPVNFASMAPLKDIIEGGFDNVLYVADAKGTVCPLCLDQHPQSSLHPANFRLLPRFGSIEGPV